MTTTFNTLPLNVAIQIATHFDLIDIRPLFQVSQRWRQIGQSDGVALHLLELCGQGNIYHNDEQKEKESNNPDSASSSSVGFHFQNRKPPSQVLQEDPELSPLIKNDTSIQALRTARLVQLFQKFCRQTKEQLYDDPYFKHVAYLSDGIEWEPYVEAVGMLVANHAPPDVTSEQREMFKEGVRQVFNLMPYELRLMHRFFSGFSDLVPFTPFGVLKFYNELDGLMFPNSAREALGHALQDPHTKVKKIAFPIGRTNTGSYRLYVLIEDMTTIEKEQNLIATGYGSSRSSADSNDNYRSEANLEKCKLTYEMQRKGRVVAMGRGCFIPLAPSLEAFFRYFVENEDLHRVVEWPISLQDFRMPLRQLMGKRAGDEEDEEEEEEETDKDDDSDPISPEEKKHFEAALKRNIHVRSAFPSVFSTSPKKRNCSIAKTSTIAGDIFVEMSAALHLGRSAYFPRLEAANRTDIPSSMRNQFFYAYQCRIWRETNSTDQEEFLPILQSRKWSIFNSKEEKEKNQPSDSVEGEGVIGLYPRLLPLREELRQNERLRIESAACCEDDDEPIDGVFEYVSGTAVPSFFGGSMEGSFTFKFIRRREQNGHDANLGGMRDPREWQDRPDNSLGSVEVQVANFTLEFDKDKNGIPFVYC